MQKVASIQQEEACVQKAVDFKLKRSRWEQEQCVCGTSQSYAGAVIVSSSE